MTSAIAGKEYHPCLWRVLRFLSAAVLEDSAPVVECQRLDFLLGHARSRRIHWVSELSRRAVEKVLRLREILLRGVQERDLLVLSGGAEGAGREEGSENAHNGLAATRKQALGSGKQD